MWGFLGIPCYRAHRKLPNNENVTQPEIASVVAGPQGFLYLYCQERVLLLKRIFLMLSQKSQVL